MSAYRTGRWSNDEIDLTKRLVTEGKSYAEIGQIVNRPEETVKSYIENKLLLNLPEDVQFAKKVEINIRESFEWKELSKQLSLDEQDVFVHHYVGILSQFDSDGDTTHTEKLQIIDAVRTEILLNRVLKRIHETNLAIQSYQSNHNVQMSMEPDDRDATLMVQIQAKIAESMGAIGAYNKEYKELMERKQNILRDIKGTRDQRIKRIEDSKESLTSWIANLISNPEMRNELGRYIEKFRIASDVSYKQLSEYYKYDDGEVEQPILNSETLKEDNG